MVARRTHAAKRVLDLVLEYQVDRQNSGARAAQRGVQAVRVHRGIRVELHHPRSRCGFADCAHVLERMHARELLISRKRRVEALQVLRHARSDQLILDRRQPRRLLRMAAAHVVLQAIRMGDECRRHKVLNNNV